MKGGEEKRWRASRKIYRSVRRHSPSQPDCGQDLVTHSKEQTMEGKTGHFTVESRLAPPSPSVTITREKSRCSDVSLISNEDVVFFPKAHTSSLNLRKTSDNPKLMDIIQDIRPTLFKTIRPQKANKD